MIKGGSEQCVNASAMFPYTWQVKKSTEERYPKLSPEDCSGKGTDHSLGTKRKKRSKKNRLDLRAKGENMTCCFAHLYARPPLSLSALCTSVNVSLFLSYFFYFVLSHVAHTRQIELFFFTIVVFVPINDECGAEEQDCTLFFSVPWWPFREFCAGALFTQRSKVNVV